MFLIDIGFWEAQAKLIETQSLKVVCAELERRAREIFERDYLSCQLKRFGGNISKTARFIGMERSALHRKLKSLDVVEEVEQAG